jgi:peroxiredoxin
VSARNGGHRRAALCGTLLTLTIAAFIGGCTKPGGSEDQSFRPLAVGDTLAPLSLQLLDGSWISVGPGQPLTLLNVWATWCTSCKEEMGDLEALQEEFGPRGLRVVGVSVEASSDRVRQFVDQTRLRFTVAHDPEQTVQQRYALVGVPETFLLGSDGRLIWRTFGNIRPALGQLREILASIGTGRQ